MAVKTINIKNLLIFLFVLFLSGYYELALFAQSVPDTFADIVDMEKPLVVNIYTTQIIKRQKAQDPSQEFFEIGRASCRERV